MELRNGYSDFLRIPFHTNSTKPTLPGCFMPFVATYRLSTIPFCDWRRSYTQQSAEYLLSWQLLMRLRTQAGPYCQILPAFDLWSRLVQVCTNLHLSYVPIFPLLAKPDHEMYKLLQAAHRYHIGVLEQLSSQSGSTIGEDELQDARVLFDKAVEKKDWEIVRRYAKAAGRAVAHTK